MATQPITITKNGKTVYVYPESVAYNSENKLYMITIPTVENNQATGAKTTKVIDLLRITKTYNVKGYLTDETSGLGIVQKNTLRDIAEGAGANGGEISCEIDPNNPVAKYKTINCYIEKMTIEETPSDLDETKTYSTDVVKYRVDITLVEGVSVTSITSS